MFFSPSWLSLRLDDYRPKSHFLIPFEALYLYGFLNSAADQVWWPQPRSPWYLSCSAPVGSFPEPPGLLSRWRLSTRAKWLWGDLGITEVLGRLPLVRTGRPDQSICKENSTFNQNCPARSFYFYIVCIAVMSFERKLSKEAYFIFKMTAPTGQFGLLVSAPRFLNFWYSCMRSWNVIKFSENKVAYARGNKFIEILANVLCLLILESISCREQLENAIGIIVEERRDI